MSVSSVIHGRMTTHGGLSALTSTRVYPNVLPQNPTLPAIAYNIIDVVPVHSAGTSSGMAESRVQVDIWSEDYLETITVGVQVVEALGRWSDAGATPVIHDVIEINRSGSYEDTLELHRLMIDFKVILTE